MKYFCPHGSHWMVWWVWKWCKQHHYGLHGHHTPTQSKFLDNNRLTIWGMTGVTKTNIPSHNTIKLSVPIFHIWGSDTAPACSQDSAAAIGLRWHSQWAVRTWVTVWCFRTCCILITAPSLVDKHRHKARAGLLSNFHFHSNMMVPIDCARLYGC